MEQELKSTITHIEMLLENCNATRFDVDNYNGNVKKLIEKLEKNFSVKQNGSELIIQND